MAKRKTRRTYNNARRKRKSQALSERILQTFIVLLVKSKGQDVTFEEIAAKSKVPVRSIYRLFKDKKSLHSAIDRHMFKYLKTSLNILDEHSVGSFGKYVFNLFDSHEQLMSAYLYSSFGRDARTLFRKKLNRALITKIRAEKRIRTNPIAQKRLAFVAALANANLWHDMKIDFGYTGADIGDSVEWAINTLIAHINGG
jgi:AcrR family transcriptional regulator